MSARTWLVRWGMTTSAVSPVRISSPPITSGRSIRWDSSSSSFAFSAPRSGEPGAYSCTGSFVGGGRRKMPGALTARL